MFFEMNGYIWNVVNVPSDSKMLIDRLGTYTVATTDPETMCIYLSEDLRDGFAKRVIAHELGHAACFSYHLIDQIHRCCYPSKRIFMEEFICNFVADYGEEIFVKAYDILGDRAFYNVIDAVSEKILCIA